MICYAIRNKKDKRYVSGFNYRHIINGKPKMIYINKCNEYWATPKLYSVYQIEQGMSELKKIPKCCELVKIEIKEV